MLKTAITEAIDVNETGVFYCLGNHDTDPSVLGDVMTEMPALFYSQLGEEFFRIDAADSLPSEGRRHAVVNGYHFLSVNPARYLDAERLRKIHAGLAGRETFGNHAGKSGAIRVCYGASARVRNGNGILRHHMERFRYFHRYFEVSAGGVFQRAHP